ncbi:MAG: hypothetical protein WCI23_06675 [Chlorobiaceae bacterium]|jgi:P pilus assembly chaperone PapD
MKILRYAIIIAALMFTAGRQARAEEPASQGYSLQDLLVTPTRVVFEKDMRSTELALVNRSDKVRSYAISFVQSRMTETGDIKEIPKEEIQPSIENRFADTFVRFTPRRVVLEPRQVQMVRMLLHKPSDLADGEYRSHLSFRLIPSADEAAKPDSTSSGIRIKLIPIYGVTIPVIVRQGSLTATARLNTLHLENKGEGRTLLSLTIEREGSRSTYGDIEAVWKSPGSKALTVGMIKGIAVYTPNTKRTVLLLLTLPKGQNLHGGQLNVRYIDHENGAENLLAASEIAVP